MKRVVLLGGSFDPGHFGHLSIAKNALKQAKADEVWFVLAAQNPFKEEGTSFEHRKKMLEILISHHKRLKICEIENSLPKPSYTIDTIKTLKQMNPDTEFLWLIGSDQIDKLHDWKNFEELQKEIEFLVYLRPGFSNTSQFKEISGTTYDISSTQIRKGESLLTHRLVLSYLIKNTLYLDETTKTKLSKYRYEHTKRVLDLALQLAQKHDVDLKKTTIAAMCHDWCKEEEKAWLKQIVSILDPKLLNLHPALYHGYAATYVLSKHYNYHDKEVLNAIKGHVAGSTKSKLGMILYIADKCDPNRELDTSALLKLSFENLESGFIATKETIEHNLREKI